LGKAVVEAEADFGVAFDADGDRAFFVDEKGELMPSYMVCVLAF
jgi:phosphomannomutase